MGHKPLEPPGIASTIAYRLQREGASWFFAVGISSKIQWISADMLLLDWLVFPSLQKLNKNCEKAYVKIREDACHLLRGACKKCVSCNLDHAK